MFGHGGVAIALDGVDFDEVPGGRVDVDKGGRAGAEEHDVAQAWATAEQVCIEIGVVDDGGRVTLDKGRDIGRLALRHVELYFGIVLAQDAAPRAGEVVGAVHEDRRHHAIPSLARRLRQAGNKI